MANGDGMSGRETPGSCILHVLGHFLLSKWPQEQPDEGFPWWYFLFTNRLHPKTSLAWADCRDFPSLVLDVSQPWLWTPTHVQQHLLRLWDPTASALPWVTQNIPRAHMNQVEKSKKVPIAPKILQHTADVEEDLRTYSLPADPSVGGTSPLPCSSMENCLGLSYSQRQDIQQLLDSPANKQATSAKRVWTAAILTMSAALPCGHNSCPLE